MQRSFQKYPQLNNWVQYLHCQWWFHESCTDYKGKFRLISITRL